MTTTLEDLDLAAYKLKKVLSGYNKSVRKQTYKGIWKMKKADLKKLVKKDFKITKKKGDRPQFRHKSGRYTAINPWAVKKK